MIPKLRLVIVTMLLAGSASATPDQPLSSSLVRPATGPATLQIDSPVVEASWIDGASGRATALSLPKAQPGPFAIPLDRLGKQDRALIKVRHQLATGTSSRLIGVTSTALDAKRPIEAHSENGGLQLSIAADQLLASGRVVIADVVPRSRLAGAASLAYHILFLDGAKLGKASLTIAPVRKASGKASLRVVRLDPITQRWKELPSRSVRAGELVEASVVEDGIYALAEVTP